MILLILAMIKEHRNSTYVHLRTKNRYFLIEESRMKIPGEGWVDAIIYSNNKGFVFVRKKDDFYNSFKKLSEWKKEKN